MKYKILEGWYDEEVGMTYLKVSNKYGVFDAVSMVNYEDKDIANRWDGYSLCQYKIDIQTTQAKYHVLQERVNGMRHMLNVLNNSGKMYYTEDICHLIKLMCNQIKTIQKEADTAYEKYKKMKQDYPTVCENILKLRREARERFNNEESAEE